jgi:hypothetical protein
MENNMSLISESIVNDMMDLIDEKFVDFVNEEWSTMSEARIDNLHDSVIEGLIKRLQGE